MPLIETVTASSRDATSCSYVLSLTQKTLNATLQVDVSLNVLINNFCPNEI